MVFDKLRKRLGDIYQQVVSEISDTSKNAQEQTSTHVERNEEPAHIEENTAQDNGTNYLSQEPLDPQALQKTIEEQRAESQRLEEEMEERERKDQEDLRKEPVEAYYCGFGGEFLVTIRDTDGNTRSETRHCEKCEHAEELVKENAKKASLLRITNSGKEDIYLDLGLGADYKPLGFKPSYLQSTAFRGCSWPTLYHGLYESEKLELKYEKPSIPGQPLIRKVYSRQCGLCPYNYNHIGSISATEALPFETEWNGFWDEEEKFYHAFRMELSYDHMLTGKTDTAHLEKRNLWNIEEKAGYFQITLTLGQTFLYRPYDSSRFKLSIRLYDSEAEKYGEEYYEVFPLIFETMSEGKPVYKGMIKATEENIGFKHIKTEFDFSWLDWEASPANDIMVDELRKLNLRAGDVWNNAVISTFESSLDMNTGLLFKDAFEKWVDTGAFRYDEAKKVYILTKFGESIISR